MLEMSSKRRKKRRGGRGSRDVEGGFLLADLDDFDDDDDDDEEEEEEEDDNDGLLPSSAASVSSTAARPASASSSSAASSHHQLRRKRRLAGGGCLAGLAVVLLVVAVIALAVTRRGASSRGGGDGGGAARAAWEGVFLAVPSSQGVEETLWAFTRYPTMAGTEGAAKAADLMEQSLRDAGLPSVERHDYRVLLSTPGERAVEALAPEEARFVAALDEGAFDGDATSSDPRVVPTFNAYGAAGNVTASLVYANYGRPEDFDMLASRGVRLNGTVAIVRYGKNFRGLKAMAAQRLGVLAVLIYSDPANGGGGGTTGRPAFPDGPWLPARGVQRGSAQYLSQFAGDPLTPGVAAKTGAEAVYGFEDGSPLPRSPSLPRIPVQPLSWADAQPLLRHLGGLDPATFGGAAAAEWVEGVPGVDSPRVGALPEGGSGGEPFTPVTVRVVMRPLFNVSTVTNVCARVPGTGPEQVVLGNHRDAWVFGAVDPHSGTAAFLEVAKGLGELYRRGWRPRRGVTMCSWDAEEFGLLGSVEWVEEFRDRLRPGGEAPAVAYLNVDVAVEGAAGGAFTASASPSLAGAIRRAAADAHDPALNQSLLAAWGPPPPPGARAEVGPLGSGSDFTPFLQHLGVASCDMHVAGSDYAVYHSVLDSFDWISYFGDSSGWGHHVAVSRAWGLLAMRLADSPVLPLDLVETGTALVAMAAAVSSAVAAQPDAPEGLRRAAAALVAACGAYTEAADTLRGAADEARATGDAALVASVNRRLAAAESGFASDRKLPGREVAWYRHKVYAPGLYSGYSASVMPGVNEPLAAGQWDVAAEEATHLADLVGAAARALLVT